MRVALLLIPALLAGCGDKPSDGWTGYAEAERRAKQRLDDLAQAFTAAARAG